MSALRRSIFDMLTLSTPYNASSLMIKPSSMTTRMGMFWGIAHMKAIIIPIAGLLLIGSLSNQAFAADDYFTLHQKYSVLNCPAANAANQNIAQRTEAISRCVDSELTAIDQSINQRYEQLLAQISAKTTSKVSKSQAPASEKNSKKSLDPLALPAPTAKATAPAFNLSRDSLEKSQQAWLKYRSTTCGFETASSAKSPSFENHIKLCLLSYTRERSEYLQWFLDHPH
jgi:uncharacterized protein YecT (DUF1311 family)